MWQARMETSNFTFEAYGASKGDARAMLRLGLEKHAAQYRLHENWWIDHEVSVRYVARGECYRNNELLRERA